VHYVEVPFNATEDLTGKTLTITFRVVSDEPVSNANVETGESDPPSFHLFIEHLNDDFTNQYYRWWCSSGGYTLGTQDN
jgi:F420-0:gamma-glutamyl ligase